MRMPDAVLTLLPAEVRNNAIFSQCTEANWNALRACYPSEEAGLDALRQSLAVILPYGADTPVSGFVEMGVAVNRTDKIAGSFAVLQDKLADDAEVLEVITKNPGVLGCAPKALAKASADDIRRAASVASGISSAFGPARRFLQSTSWWDEGAAKQKEKQAPAKEAWDPLGLRGGADDGEGELELPEIWFDGEPYLYDLKGECNGVEHLLLTPDGEPVGVWNPQTQEPEAVEFCEEEEEE